MLEIFSMLDFALLITGKQKYTTPTRCITINTGITYQLATNISTAALFKNTNIS